MKGLEVKPRTTPHYQKDYIRALLLCLFFGFLGIHRFYTSYKRLGFAQMVLFFCAISFFAFNYGTMSKTKICIIGLFFTWWLIDLLAMCFNRYKDKYGQELDEYNPMIASIVLTAVAIVIMALGITYGVPVLLGI